MACSFSQVTQCIESNLGREKVKEREGERESIGCVNGMQQLFAFGFHFQFVIAVQKLRIFKNRKIAYGSRSLGCGGICLLKSTLIKYIYLIKSVLIFGNRVSDTLKLGFKILKSNIQNSVFKKRKRLL